MKSQNESKVDFRRLIPLRKVDWECNESGIVVLLRPRFRNRFLAKHLLPRIKRPNIRIKLDEIGSWVWQKIDGKNDVTAIAEEMQANFGEKIEPVDERLQLFLNALAKNRFITLYSVKSD